MTSYSHQAATTAADPSRPVSGRGFCTLPCCDPIVGLITMLSTRRKQRVGDLVAKPFVVRAAERGRPVTPAEPSAPAGYPPNPG